MASSSSWTAVEWAALQPVTLWAGDRQIPLDGAADKPIVIGQADLFALSLRYPEGALDPSSLGLVVDYDPALGGYPVRFYRVDQGRLEPERQGMVQLAGQRFIGDSRTVLAYRGRPVAELGALLRFEPNPEVKRQYDVMRQDLADENGLVLDFYGLANLWAEWEEDGAQAAPANLERFAMVRWAFDQAFPILRRIAARPLQDLATEGRRLPIHQAGSLKPTALLRAATDGTPWVPRPDGRGRVPISVQVDRPCITYANPENSFVRRFVMGLVVEARSLQALAVREVEELRQLLQNRFGTWGDQTRHQLERAQRGYGLMREVEEQLSALLEEPFLRDCPATSQGPTHRLSGNPLYRQVYRISQQLRWGLQLSDRMVNLAALPLRTRSINVLYEYWLAAAVQRCLVDRLGFEPVGHAGHLLEVDRTALNAVVAEGSSVDLKGPDGLLCRLCYGKRYPLLRFDPEAALGVEEAIIDGQRQRKSTPDLALELYRPGQPIPVMITMDATYTFNPELLQKKHYYLETVRSRAYPGQPPEEWGYPVAEAWAVYPGSHTTSPRPRGFTGGEFGLVPGEGAEAELAQWLEGVFERVLG